LNLANELHWLLTTSAQHVMHDSPPGLLRSTHFSSSSAATPQCLVATVLRPYSGLGKRQLRLYVIVPGHRGHIAQETHLNLNWSAWDEVHSRCHTGSDGLQEGPDL